MEQQHGILLLNKPKGLSSARAISRLKRLGQKKIGHAGTLDPMATGLLIVLLGEATKISSYLLEAGEKTYIGVLKLGTVTDTWDAEGEIIEENDFSHISPSDVQDVVSDWLGASIQEVPPYSAAKHNGQALYKLARAGKEVPIKNKEIFISQAKIINLDFPFVRFEVKCSSGSYIRSLAHSLGKRLGCGAMLTELTRTYSHPFYLDDAFELEDLLNNCDNFQEKVVPIQNALPAWNVHEVNLLEAKKIANGNFILHRPEFGIFTLNAKAFLSHSDKVIALAIADHEGEQEVWKILRGLVTN